MKPRHAQRISFVVALGVCLSLDAVAADDGWKVVSTSPTLIKTRSQRGTNVKEVWAQQTIDADVIDVQETILATADYPRFMPYVKEARRLLNEAAPNAFYSYTRLTLPIIGGRDYVVKSVVEQRVTEPGKGTFRQSWVSEPELIPLRNSVTRIRINQGHWLVTSEGKGKSTLVYSLLTDPGGVPAFVVDMANRTGVQGTLEAVEKEAKARGQKRVLKEKRRLAEEQEQQRKGGERDG